MIRHVSRRLVNGSRRLLLEDVLFHCQQAVEKTLKGFLAWHDVPFRKTHSLEELGAACERLDPTLKTALLPAEAVPAALGDQLS